MVKSVSLVEGKCVKVELDAYLALSTGLAKDRILSMTSCGKESNPAFKFVRSASIESISS